MKVDLYVLLFSVKIQQYRLATESRQLTRDFSANSKKIFV